MDFIIGLLILEDYNVIFIVINYIIKKGHYISYIGIKEGINLEKIV